MGLLLEERRLDTTSGACGQLNSWESFVADTGTALKQAYAEPIGIAFVGLAVAVLVLLTVRCANPSRAINHSLGVMILVSLSAAMIDLVVNPMKAEPQRFSLTLMATFFGVGGLLLFRSHPANR
jgi:hypothetical protein